MISRFFHSNKRLFMLLALLSVFFLPFEVRAQDSQVLDEIVAVVGDQIILKSEVDGFVGQVVTQQGFQYSNDLWKEALNQMIEDKVLVIHAKRDTNLTVPETQVDELLDQRMNTLAARVGGMARLEQMYGKPLIEVKQELRPEFRDLVLVDQYRNKKRSSVRATPTDIRQWFAQIPTDSLPTIPDRVQVSHIVRFPEVTPEAREEAHEILSAIRDSVIAGGTTIEEMARLFSDDQGSASNGGLYEDTPLSELVPEFAAVASRTSIGIFSQIFETQYGLHFLRVNARRGDNIDYNHILIQFDERKSDPTEAIAFLSTVRDSILTDDASFSALARDHSEEEISAIRGGRVTDPRSGERNLPLDDLDPTWQSTIIPLQEGDISEPTETSLLTEQRRAYHIVRLDKFIPAHKLDLETDYKLIEQYATQDKQARVLAEWVDRLKESVYVDLRGKAAELMD